MNEIILRALELDTLQVQRDDGDGRVLIGRALTYGVPYEVSDNGGFTSYREVWRSGVFAKSLTQRAGRIPLMVLHDRRRLPIGATLGVEPSEEAFIFRAKVSRTREGDEALELVHDGALTGISLGARPLNNRAIAGGVERVEAVLQEISLTPFAQMADAGVLAVRSLDPPADDEHDDEADETPILDECRSILSTITRP